MANRSQEIEVKRGSKAPAAPGTQNFLSLRSQIDRMIEDFSRMFDRDSFSNRFFEMPRFPRMTSEVNAVMPAMDVSEDEKSFRVTAELPGIDQKDVEVHKEGDVLTIKGEKKEEREEKEKGIYVSERQYGSFMRSLRIPEGIDENKIEAKFENGVLTVVLPKSPETITKPKKIEVKSK